MRRGIEASLEEDTSYNGTLVFHVCQSVNGAYRYVSDWVVPWNVCKIGIMCCESEYVDINISCFVLVDQVSSV